MKPSIHWCRKVLNEYWDRAFSRPPTAEEFQVEYNKLMESDESVWQEVALDFGIPLEYELAVFEYFTDSITQLENDAIKTGETLSYEDVWKIFTHQLPPSIKPIRYSSVYMLDPSEPDYWGTKRKICLAKPGWPDNNKPKKG